MSVPFDVAIGTCDQLLLESLYPALLPLVGLVTPLEMSVITRVIICSSHWGLDAFRFSSRAVAPRGHQ